MKNLRNATNSTCQNGYSAHSESSFVCSSDDDAKNTIKGKSKFFSFTKICTFSLLVLMYQCYENGNSNSSVCTFNGLKNGAGLRSLRMLGSVESKEDEFEGVTIENEDEEGLEVEKETKKCSGNKNCKELASPCVSSNAVDQACQTDCGACTCGLKTLDLYFEKKLLDILDAGNKKAGQIADASAHALSGLKNYLKYVLLFSPLLLEFLASKLLLSGYYKSSQFVSSVCVSFYLYVFYKIVQNCALGNEGYMAYESCYPYKSPFRRGRNENNYEDACTNDVCPRSSSKDAETKEKVPLGKKKNKNA
ncbi:Plasmodium exported protein, unknown function [Plasmodium knowlesi strain H]|uniref:Uncharacterized protein n=3 Tax=Plasmodium knowlesi TaxID=5850 RepID=A0A5E7X4W0_PLAKH|nr:Plasmodium exported protein, unknown function [Plasmodium knowlesi strain H]OTN66272.1 Uncharacterized protein PKNOH_S09551100 [Plasmodium knowlesi]CAA9989803.1 Plasmodium exported protein, unknown function [Plasmodium knowlesi strain H]SBO24345.1 Plasmodium exported protein, unknown function [Plasmodium knowlesi strain H]SBO26704.1 Plasmodium exported protein, unknown function [Plasmodium knowlesi strain H]VVS79277.1 Plasmodium exported protein, unknown function [Plasmodium knowlesi strain